MSVKEIVYGGGGLLLVILTFVQISPIKINPWSWFAKKVGRAINKEVLEKVDKLDEALMATRSELKTVRSEAVEQVAVNCRARILRFGDEVLHGEYHSKDHFDQILRDIKAYERYCEDHPEFENNVTELTSKRIKAVYEKCITQNNFL